MDVGGYLDQREKEIQGLSAHPARLAIAEEEGSDGQRGRLIARVWLNDEAFVEVHELVAIVEGRPHRERFAYFLCLDGQEVGGYERDPTHDPAEHRHCSEREEHERFPHPAVSFKAAMEEAWD